MFNDSNVSNELKNSISILRLTLIFVFITSFLLIFFVFSMFGDTFGYCDRRQSDGSSSFSFLVVMQLALQAPVIYFYHSASIFATINSSQMSEHSSQQLLGTSFMAYLFSAAILLYIMLNLFFNGGNESSQPMLMLTMAFMAFALSFILLIRYDRTRE